MPGAFDVELITSRPAERMLLVRPDLRVDAERTQERERSSGNRGSREIEMQRDLPAAAQVHAARGVEQTGQLRESIAVRFGRDLGELVAESLRERHPRAPRVASCTQARTSRTTQGRRPTPRG